MTLRTYLRRSLAKGATYFTLIMLAYFVTACMTIGKGVPLSDLLAVVLGPTISL